MDAIYLDNNATTATCVEVLDAILAALRGPCGNPSSEHRPGARARALLERAREQTAALIGADPRQVVFTSGATEANNQVLTSAAALNSAPAHLVTTEAEHLSVLAPCEALAANGARVTRVRVDAGGRVCLGELAEAITPATALVSVHWVNGETGVVQPMEQIAELCRDRGVPLHSDAAQAVGKLPVDVSAVPVDFLSLSGHKFHAPAGVGALFARDPARLVSMLRGGPQERGLRAGTENVAGIVGLGVATERRAADFGQVSARIAQLRDDFEREILRLVPGTCVNGDVRTRVCNTTSLRFEGVDGPALVARLDAAGVCCSQSSACTSMRPEPSHVLIAMGLSEEQAYASIRCALSEMTTQEELQRAAAHIATEVDALRAWGERWGA